MRNDADAIAFADVANEFVGWVESRTGETADEVETLHGLLGRLTFVATRLAHVESDDGDDPPRAGLSHAEVLAKLADFPIDLYDVVFDPLAADGEPPLKGSVHDDLHGIYSDLRLGFAYMRQGRTESAIWEWRFGYYCHWGRHLTHAQSALWQHLANAG